MSKSLRDWTFGIAAALSLGAGTALALASQPPAAPATSQASAKAKTPHYTRVIEAEDGTLTLQIAAKTFAPAAGKQGPKIHLVGAVHIADKPFYTSLQTLLDATDLVLFEGVKPPGAGAFDATLDAAGKEKATKARLKFLLTVLEDERARNGKLPESLEQAVEESGKRWKTMIASSLTDAWGHAIVYQIVDDADVGGQYPVVRSLGPNGTDDKGAADDLHAEGKSEPKKHGAKDAGLQAKLADSLGLTFQLDAMDSSKPNWRSSDMSVDQLQARMEESGVEGSQLFSLLDGSSFMGQLASILLGFVKSNPQVAASVKMSMVEMLGSPDAIGAGPASMRKMMDVILKDRNDVVLHDLRAVIDNEQRKDVAVFYGAGHLADMEAKLKSDFGYEFADEEWFSAISVNPKAAGMTAEQAKRMRETMRRQLERQAEAAKSEKPRKPSKKPAPQTEPASPEKP